MELPSLVGAASWTMLSRSHENAALQSRCTMVSCPRFSGRNSGSIPVQTIARGVAAVDRDDRAGHIIRGGRRKIDARSNRSDAWPQRPTGVRRITACSNGVPRSSSVISVKYQPGTIALT